MVRASAKKKFVRESDAGHLNDKTVAVSRVSKVVKGGRRFSFSALVVSGDGQGRVGYGLGKAAEVPEAIRKASEQARKSLISVPIRGTTIPHEIIARSGPCTVILKPASPGTGVIAGSVVRSILEGAGIKDIRTKCLGSSNPSNVLRATIAAILQLRDPEDVVALRGLSLEEVEYAPF